jgi:ATP-dependent RNA helicase DHX57
VDGWLRLRGWARIGVLVSRLRGVIDGLIERRVEGTTTTTTGGAGSESEIIRLVTRLIELDGLDA